MVFVLWWLDVKVLFMEFEVLLEGYGGIGLVGGIMRKGWFVRG